MCQALCEPLGYSGGHDGQGPCPCGANIRVRRMPGSEQISKKGCNQIVINTLMR